MAVGETRKGTTAAASGARRFVVGTNVLVTVGLALAVAAFATWYANRHSFRRDLSRLGAYALSSRAEKVLAKLTQPVELTAIYTSDDPEKDRAKYRPRVLDLFAEMQRQSPLVKTAVLESDGQKRALEQRISEKFGSQAQEYVEALNKARMLDDELSAVLEQEAAALTQLRDAQAWIARAPSFTNIIENLNSAARELKSTREKVEELTGGKTLPDYGKARETRDKTFNEIREILEECKRWQEENARMVGDLGGGRSGLIGELPQRLGQLPEIMKSLEGAAGAVGAPMPDDPMASVRAFGEAAERLQEWLEVQIADLTKLSEQYPTIVEHPLWSVKVGLLGALGARIELPMILGDVREQIAGLLPQIEQISQREITANQARAVLEKIRNLTRDLSGTIQGAGLQLKDLPGDFANIDEASRQFVARTNAPYGGLVEKLNEMEKAFDALPPLELGDLGQKLRQDNAIVVESGGTVRVITFDDVWPVEMEDLQIPGRQTELRRVFNGDAAVSTALLGLAQERPVARVIFAIFEPEVPQEMRRFIRQPQGATPIAFYERLKERLENANCIYQQWNLAYEEAPPAAEKPEQAEVPVVYFVLPPIVYQVPPMGGQSPIPEFDEEKKQRLAKAIGDNGRALFLCTYSPPQGMMMGMFGGGPVSQPRYPYQEYLEKTWGVAPRTTHRVMLGVPHEREPGLFGVSQQSYAWMSINNFSTHPIGRPMRYRNLPMFNVVPVQHAEEVPEGVKLADVLSVPPLDEFWACQNIEDIVRAILTPETNGFVRKDTDPSDGFLDIPSPFPTIVTAENAAGGRVVVSGNAETVWDYYLNQPIPRSDKKGRLFFEPAPIANADLMVNAVYWLAGAEELIGAGPVVTPAIGPMSSEQRQHLSLLVVGWAAMALVAGGVVWFVRRK